MSLIVDRVFNFLTFILLNPIFFQNYRKKDLIFFILTLNSLYTVFSFLCSCYLFALYFTNTFNIGLILQFFQTFVPCLISFYLVIDFVWYFKLFLAADSSLKCNQIKGLKVKVIVFLLIVTFIRACKIITSLKSFLFVIYGLCSMMPELVASMSDFAFAVYVDNLTHQIKKFNDDLRLQQIDWKVAKEVEKALSEFHQISQDICRVYSSRLFVTLSCNFVQLVIALFWIFIRVAFNHFDRIEGFATFLYIVQPILCFFVVFQAAHQNSIAVRKFFKR
jgi:hypothetical protein